MVLGRIFKLLDVFERFSSEHVKDFSFELPVLVCVGTLEGSSNLLRLVLLLHQNDEVLVHVLLSAFLHVK